MEKYFNRIDREHNLALLMVYFHLSEWLEKTKSLNSDERKWIKTGCTYIKKAADSMIKRASSDYQRAIYNDAKNKSLILQDERPNVSGEKFVDTVQLVKDDFLDLCEKAIWKCKQCRYKGWKKCDRYTLFIKLGVPVVDEDTDYCPYRM